MADAERKILVQKEFRPLVLEFLNEVGKATTTEVAEAFEGVNQIQARKALKHLLSEKLVRHEGTTRVSIYMSLDYDPGSEADAKETEE